VVIALDHNNLERSSVERQHLPVIGTTLPFGEKKGSKRYRIELDKVIILSHFYRYFKMV